MVFAFFFRFRFAIKMMSGIEELFSTMSSKNSADEVSKRDFLIKKVENGESISDSKTPWTEKRLRIASEKEVGQLYDDLDSNNTDALNNLLSRELGVKNFEKMMDEMNRNPLLRSNMTKICGNLSTSGHTSMELFGSMMYSKFGLYLAPVSAFCTIFNHLDWQGFEKISRERERERYKENDTLNFFEESAQVENSSENRKDDCATNK